MKIQELFNIDKALEEKRKELEALRQEAEELQMMIDVNTKKEDTVDISNVYDVTYENIHYFCQKKEEVIISTWVYFYDIFSDREILCTGKGIFLMCNRNSTVDFSAYPIREVFKEVNVYPNEQVPRLLLQKLYYQVNKIDAKTLKKAIKMGNRE